MVSAWIVSTSSRPMVSATVMPPSRMHRNIARGRRFSISSKSMASSLGFSAAVNASAKNSAFIAAQPAFPGHLRPTRHQAAGSPRLPPCDGPWTLPGRTYEPCGLLGGCLPAVQCVLEFLLVVLGQGGLQDSAAVLAHRL